MDPEGLFLLIVGPRAFWGLCYFSTGPAAPPPPPKTVSFVLLVGEGFCQHWGSLQEVTCCSAQLRLSFLFSNT